MPIQSGVSTLGSGHWKSSGMTNSGDRKGPGARWGPTFVCTGVTSSLGHVLELHGLSRE